MKYTVKKHLTKALSLIMVLILLTCSLSACGDAKDGDKETTPSVNVENEPEVPENNAGGESNGEKDNEEEHDFTRVFTLDSLEPLSKEKQAEVEAAWKENSGKDIGWCESPLKSDGTYVEVNRYYGIYNNNVLILTHSIMDGSMEIVLAGQTIVHYGCWATMWVYSNGEFYRLTEENQYDWFTEDDLLKIVEYHREYEEYMKEIRNSTK